MRVLTFLVAVVLFIGVTSCGDDEVTTDPDTTVEDGANDQSGEDTA